MNEHDRTFFDFAVRMHELSEARTANIYVAGAICLTTIAAIGAGAYALVDVGILSLWRYDLLAAMYGLFILIQVVLIAMSAFLLARAVIPRTSYQALRLSGIIKNAFSSHVQTGAPNSANDNSLSAVNDPRLDLILQRLSDAANHNDPINEKRMRSLKRCFIMITGSACVLGVHAIIRVLMQM